MSNAKIRRTQAERTALSDQRMFDSAMELICRQGANRTTLKQICEQAGYSRGLANYRFGSKDVFLEQLLHHFNLEWTARLSAHIGNASGVAAFFRAIDALESFLNDHSAYMRGGYLVWYESIGGENAVQAKLQSNHDAYRRDTAKWLSQGQLDGDVRADVDPEQFSVLYCSIVFGTVFQWLAKPEAIDLATFFNYWRQQARTLLMAGSTDDGAAV